MNIPENYYSILEVNRNATNSEIKKSYRKLAMKYHPDKCSGEEDRFKKIAEAYSVLSDKTKKSQYDICGFSEINIGDPMEIFSQIFSDFNPDIFANISDNIINKFSNNENSDTKIFIKTFVSEDNFSNKINQAIPNIFDTFQNVVNGQEDDSLKTGFMKTFLNGAMSSMNYNNDEQNLDNEDSQENISLTKEEILKNEFKDDNSRNTCMKPKDIIIKKNYPLKEFYLDKNKRIKFIKTEIIDTDEKKISEILKVPIYYNKEIRFKGMGHNKKNHTENGDVIFKFDCIKNELFKIHGYHLIHNKNINVSNLYGEFKFDLELPNDTKIEIKCNDLYKTDLIMIKENLGLPIPNENKRSDLFIKFNVIYPDLNDKDIQSLREIFTRIY
jgi:DnaJ-class molecular chaperone